MLTGNQLLKLVSDSSSKMYCELLSLLWKNPSCPSDERDFLLSGEACPDREKLMKSGVMGTCGAVVVESLCCRP